MSFISLDGIIGKEFQIEASAIIAFYPAYVGKATELLLSDGSIFKVSQSVAEVRDAIFEAT